MTKKSTLSRERLRESNQTRPRSGRPRQLSEDQRDHLYEVANADTHATYEDMLDHVDHAVKKRSIQRLLHEMGRRKWQRNRPALTPHHVTQRLAWAQEYKSFYTRRLGVCQMEL